VPGRWTRALGIEQLSQLGEIGGYSATVTPKMRTFNEASEARRPAVSFWDDRLTEFALPKIIGAG
jgi:hypothetical protein